DLVLGLHSFPTRRSSDLGYHIPEILKLLHHNAGLLPSKARCDVGLLMKGNEIYQSVYQAMHLSFSVYLAVSVSLILLQLHHPLRSEEHTSELQSRENLVC